jgi:DNA polymerase-3 subunit gamma/tau
MSTGPSLYRRHRPRTFADVVGQEHVVRTLSNAIAQGKVHHAYLFVGSRGTGKTSMAKILAACLNCDQGPTTAPCGRCDSCVAIANATSLDVIEMDAASNNSVDDIRDLREKVAYAPVSGRHKVYILDEAHMLSPQAWNAFLKTLEEPPPRTIFVLATTEAQKVLPTVVDRCHRFDFGRPTAAQVATVLRRVADQEGVAAEDAALALIARHASGSFRDALGTLEQLITYVGERPIEPDDVLAVLGVADAEALFGALDAVIARDPAAALRAAAALADSGRDPGQLLRDLEAHARELLAVQVLGEVPPELRLTAERDRRLAEQAAALPGSDAVRLLDLVSDALRAASNGASPRIQLELVLLRAAAPQIDPSLSALLSRIERLEAGRGGSGGGRQGPAATPASGPAATPARDPAATPAGSQAATPAGATGRGSADGAAPAEEARTHTAAEAQPAAAEPVVTQTSGEPLDLPTAIERWAAVVELIRAQNQMLSAALASARPVAVSERELTVAFPADAQFSKRLAEQDGHRRAVVEAFRQVCGEARALRYELRELEPPAMAAPRSAAGVSGEELVRRLLEEFDAEELPDDHDQREEI